MINKPADLCYSYNNLPYKKENKLPQQEDIKIQDQLLTLDNSINMNDEIKNNNLAKKRSIRDVTLAKNKADVTVNMLITSSLLFFLQIKIGDLEQEMILLMTKLIQ